MLVKLLWHASLVSAAGGGKKRVIFFSGGTQLAVGDVAPGGNVPNFLSLELDADAGSFWP